MSALQLVLRTVILLLPIGQFASAQLSLPSYFSDHMVLQRDKPMRIQGKGKPGNPVKLSFGKMRMKGRVMADSTWEITLPPQGASTVGRTLLVRSGDRKISYQDILTGDVWVCIGQSNMEWPMSKEMHFREDISQPLPPAVRIYNPSYAGKNTFGAAFSDSIRRSLTTEGFYRGKWQVCDSVSIRTMSAVAYHFGRTVNEKTGVPVGLMNLSIGGAPLESFINPAAMRDDAEFASKMRGDWLVNEALPEWIRERGRQNMGGQQGVSGDGNGSNHGFKPGFAYTCALNPMRTFAVKGILCYQGESNAQEPQRVNEYGRLSALMIRDLRKGWQDSTLPFYFVQLSSIDTVKYKGRLWPIFRDVQRQMESDIPFTGMAVCSDIGARDDVHPTDKRTVGQRLARQALYRTYGSDIIPSGPLPAEAIHRNGKIIIRFKYATGGLFTADGQALRGFMLNGTQDVPARIAGETVEIDCDVKPETICYGWKSFSDGNLVNREKLPASTFSLEVRQGE